MTNNEYVSFDIYEINYIIKNTHTGIAVENTMLVKAETYEEAKKHLFDTIENDTYQIISHTIRNRVVWKKKETGPSFDGMPVICTKESAMKLPKRGVLGEKYFIKRSSIYIDPDGDIYGELYEDNALTEYMANVQLKRFISI